MKFICYKGTLFKAEEPVLTLSNRGFKYGDGIFETMKYRNGELLLPAFHFERLFASLKVLQIPASFAVGELVAMVDELCLANHVVAQARVRLSVFRNEQGLAEYAIEAVTLPDEKTRWNERGWTIDLYPYARKSCDVFAGLKTSNYLPYVMADLFAKEKDLDEALVLNTHGRICDGSKTNLFLIKGEEIITPALHQGCVNGVMRRHVIDLLKKQGFVVRQAEVEQDDLLQADEVFLTNAIQGIKWVSQFGEKRYSPKKTLELYSLLTLSL